jgi:hypothetical protein
MYLQSRDVKHLNFSLFFSIEAGSTTEAMLELTNLTKLTPIQRSNFLKQTPGRGGPSISWYTQTYRWNGAPF